MAICHERGKKRGDTRSVHVESEFLCKDGSIKAISSQTTVTEELYIVICEDVTKEKLLPKNAHQRFTKDPITKCYSLKALISHHRIIEQGEHLFFFDLDKLHGYEEIAGKHKVTELLKDFVSFLQHNTREENDVYHYDNTTYALLIKTSKEGVTTLIQRLKERWLKQCLSRLKGRSVSFCTGVVSIQSTQTMETAIIKATQALHQAQWDGPDTTKILEL